MSVEKDWRSRLTSGCVFTGRHEADKWGMYDPDCEQTIKIVPDKPVRVSAPGMNSSYQRVKTNVEPSTTNLESSSE